MHCLMHRIDGLEHRIDASMGEWFQGEVLGQVLLVKFGRIVPQFWRHFIIAVGQHKLVTTLSEEEYSRIFRQWLEIV